MFPLRSERTASGGWGWGGEERGRERDSPLGSAPGPGRERAAAPALRTGPARRRVPRAAPGGVSSILEAREMSASVVAFARWALLVFFF